MFTLYYLFIYSYKLFILTLRNVKYQFNTYSSRKYSSNTITFKLTSNMLKIHKNFIFNKDRF